MSTLNGCQFCSKSHTAFAALQLPGGAALVETARHDPAQADLSPKVKALLAIARQVRRAARPRRWRRRAGRARAGRELHDPVLIAAAFCMFNRDVDGLGTWAPSEPAAYAQNAEMIVAHGYSATAPRWKHPIRLGPRHLITPQEFPGEGLPSVRPTSRRSAFLPRSGKVSRAA